MSAAAQVPTYQRICAVTDVPAEGALRVQLDGRAVAVVASAGEVFVIDDMCTHQEVSLSDGDVAGGRIECWLHGSQFDLRTGWPAQPPAVAPVTVFPVRIDGGDVFAALQESR